MKKTIQDGSRHLAYPASPNHTVLSSHVLTDATVLTDTLSSAGEHRECRLVQLLVKLEKAQVGVAHIHMLNIEEDRVTEVDDTALLRISVTEAKLAPKFVECDTFIKEFTAFYANIPPADTEHATFAQYKFQEMTKQLHVLADAQMNVALDRWRCALDTACKPIKQSLPDSWKSKVVDTMDEEYIRSHILVQSLISAMGNDYIQIKEWLDGLNNVEMVHTAFVNKWKGEVEDHITTIEDARQLVACILAYNTILNKFGKQTIVERRQAWKDIRKKIKTKLKGDCTPEAVINRAQKAISGK